MSLGLFIKPLQFCRMEYEHSEVRTSNVNEGDDRKNVKQIGLCIFLAGLSCFAQLYLFQPIMPELARQFHINPAESSFAVSFSTMGMAVGLFSGIFFADRISRKKLISIALISSSVLTILSSFAGYFWVLIAINTVKGILLAGSASVVVAYIAEEVHPGVLGTVTSMNIAGNAVGGMSGRIVTTLLTGWLDWEWAACTVGIFCLGCGLLFAWTAPESLHFRPVKINAGNKIKEMKRHLCAVPLLSMFILGAILLGCFVSVYNYLGFRLENHPFDLPHEVIASIYLMYILGSIGSMAGGVLSDRHGVQKTLIFMLILMLFALFFLLPGNILPVAAGLGVFTFAFFGAHAIASRVVAQYIPFERSTSISIYLLFYYLGSSILGTVTGIIMHHWGWTAFVLSLCILAFGGVSLLTVVGKSTRHAAR